MNDCNVPRQNNFVNNESRERNPSNRDFKGIWIPREIWLSDFSCQEKCLWAEIHSLLDRSRGGCYASNEYLCGFFGIKERRLQEMMANLKERGWLVQVSFDGRTRILRAVVPSENFEPDKSAGQRCTFPHPSDAEKCTPRMQDSAPPSIYIEKSIEKSIEPLLKVPEEPAAIAANVCVSNLPKDLKKPKKAKEINGSIPIKPEDFSSVVWETAQHMAELLKKYCPVYRLPADMRGFTEQVRILIEDDHQDVKVILETFEWAISNNESSGNFKGWPAVIANNKYGRNPPQNFRAQFSTIYPQMNHRIKRKFAPCSDQKAAVKGMEEMRTL